MMPTKLVLAQTKTSYTINGDWNDYHKIQKNTNSVLSFYNNNIIIISYQIDKVCGRKLKLLIALIALVKFW